MVDSDYCPECDAFLRKGAAFCHICGFVLDVEEQELTFELTSEDKVTAMEKDIRSTALWLLLIGVIQIFTSGFLSVPWGLFLILVGLASFYFRERVMFVVYSVTMGWAALSNLLSSQTVWIGLAVVQIIWAISLFRKFFHYEKAERGLEQKPDARLTLTPSPPSQSQRLFPYLGCLFGIISFGGFIAMSVSLVIYMVNFEPDQIVTGLEFGLDLMVNIGVLGVSVSLASLLSKFNPRYLPIGGMISGGLTMIFFLALALIP